MSAFRTAIAAVALLGATGLAAPASAATEGDYRMIGMGTSSCGTWTAARRFPAGTDARLATQWVVGFLSGIGFIGENGDAPLEGIDAEAVFEWIDTYCVAHPIESLAHAAGQFYFSHPRPRP